MNKTRRVKIANSLERINDAMSELTMVLSEERDYRDYGVPENMTEKAQQAEDTCDNLEECLSALEESVGSLLKIN